MTKKEKTKLVEKKLEGLGTDPTEFVVVTDEEKEAYLVTISEDMYGVENYRQENADSLFSTIFISREVVGRDFIGMGDEELTDSILRTLYEKRKDPDWVILSLGWDAPPTSWANPRLFRLAMENDIWWDEEELEEEGYVTLRRRICGFITTYKRKWIMKTGMEWDRDKIVDILQDELVEHNRWLKGDALHVEVKKWRPRTLKEFPGDPRTTYYAELEAGCMGGFPADDISALVEQISDAVGTEKWHEYDEEKDILRDLTRKFVVKSYDCPICGMKDSISGYVYPTAFTGVCPKCGSTLITNRPYFKSRLKK